jgi:hypothetical protein
MEPVEKRSISGRFASEGRTSNMWYATGLRTIVGTFAVQPGCKWKKNNERVIASKQQLQKISDGSFKSCWLWGTQLTLVVVCAEKCRPSHHTDCAGQLHSPQ